MSGATGRQAAFLQQVNASVSQNFSFTGEKFSVNFLAEGRSGSRYGSNPFAVYVDQTLLTFLGLTSITPSAGSTFALYTSDLLALTTGTHTLKFVSLGSGGRDVTSFIDEVNGNSVPEPTSIALMGLGLLGFAAMRRTPKK